MEQVADGQGEDHVRRVLEVERARIGRGPQCARKNGPAGQGRVPGLSRYDAVHI